MSHSDEGPQIKSMRHRRILDLAAEYPDASLDELASMVPSATTDLVENVIEEHGDPAEEDAESPDGGENGDGEGQAGQGETEPAVRDEAEPADQREVGSADQGEVESADQREAEPDVTTDTSSGADDDTGDSEAAGADEYPSPAELSPKQRETLRAVAAQPDATQEAIAAELGVTAPTVSNRVNSIDGFDWSRRETFVTAVFDANPESDERMSSNETPEETDLEQFEDRLSALEERIDGDDARSETAFEDPELVHKVVHACLQSEAISEEEELRILEAVLA